jgi:hypothetical protein
MKPEGKVVSLMDEYTLIANIGEDDGVEEEDRYVVYTLSDEIEDPDTGESLGRIEYTKALVRPVHIKDNMSIMRSDESTKSPLQTQLMPLTGSTKKLADKANFQYADDEVKEGDLIRFDEQVDDSI